MPGMAAANHFHETNQTEGAKNETEHFHSPVAGGNWPPSTEIDVTLTEQSAWRGREDS